MIRLSSQYLDNEPRIRGIANGHSGLIIRSYTKAKARQRTLVEHESDHSTFPNHRPGLDAQLRHSLSSTDLTPDPYGQEQVQHLLASSGTSDLPMLP